MPIPPTDESAGFLGTFFIEKRYDAFGDQDALYKDPDSFSYVTEADEHTWLLLLDVNASSSDNAFSQNTLTWIKEVLHLFV